MSETVNRERLTQFVINTDQEILNMQAGEGTRRPGTLHFEIGKASPVMHRWSIFKETPTQSNLNQFIEIAKQDFGSPTGELFEGQSQAIFTPDPATVSKPVPKAFDVAIKDSFYDMFRTARIAMEPKQVERIEAIALNLADVIEKKIATAVGFAVGNTVKDQLGALLKGLKEKKAAKPAKRQKIQGGLEDID